MNNIITANDLKIKGISIVEESLKDGLEAVITVRGKEKYIVLSKDKYNLLREFELTVALMESERDLKDGRFEFSSVDEHLKRITNA